MGGVLTVSGIALSVCALLYWKQQGYSALVPEIVMRITIPAASLTELGLQSVFLGFIIGILKIRLAGNQEESSGQELGSAAENREES